LKENLGKAILILVLAIIFTWNLAWIPGRCWLELEPA
jgi:hypothetical protein